VKIVATRTTRPKERWFPRKYVCECVVLGDVGARLGLRGCACDERKEFKPRDTGNEKSSATNNVFPVLHVDRLRNRFVEIFKMDAVSVRLADFIMVRAPIRWRRRSAAAARKCFMG